MPVAAGSFRTTAPIPSRFDFVPTNFTRKLWLCCLVAVKEHRPLYRCQLDVKCAVVLMSAYAAPRATFGSRDAAPTFVPVTSSNLPLLKFRNKIGSIADALIHHSISFSMCIGDQDVGPTVVVRSRRRRVRSQRYEIARPTRSAALVTNRPCLVVKTIDLFEKSEIDQTGVAGAVVVGGVHTSRRGRYRLR